MITKSKAFTTSDGNQYATLEIAQRAELLKLLTPTGVTDGEVENTNKVLNTMFALLDEVKDILRATGRKARKAKNGTVRTRRTVVKAGAKIKDPNPV